MVVIGGMPRDLTKCPRCGCQDYMTEAQLVCDKCMREKRQATIEAVRKAEGIT